MAPHLTGWILSEFVATVEHEIGHAVAIWHHGEADTPSGGYDGYVYWYTPDGVTLKEIGKVTDPSFVDTLQRAGSGR